MSLRPCSQVVLFILLDNLYSYVKTVTNIQNTVMVSLDFNIIDLM